MKNKKKLPKYNIGGILSSGVSGAATGASIGGPWGAVIGGAAGLLGGAFSSNSANNAKRKQKALQQQQFERQFDLQQEQFDFQKKQANMALASQIDAQKMQADATSNANALAMQAENTKKLAGIDTAGTLRDFNIFKNGGQVKNKESKFPTLSELDILTEENRIMRNLGRIDPIPYKSTRLLESDNNLKSDLRKKFVSQKPITNILLEDELKKENDRRRDILKSKDNPNIKDENSLNFSDYAYLTGLGLDTTGLVAGATGIGSTGDAILSGLASTSNFIGDLTNEDKSTLESIGNYGLNIGADIGTAIPGVGTGIGNIQYANRLRRALPALKKIYNGFRAANMFKDGSDVMVTLEAIVNGRKNISDLTSEDFSNIGQLVRSIFQKKYGGRVMYKYGGNVVSRGINPIHKKKGKYVMSESPRYQKGGIIDDKQRISSPQEREFYQSDLKYLYGDYNAQNNYQTATASPERYAKGIENAVRRNDLEAAKRLHSQLKRFRPDIYENQLYGLRKNVLSPEQYMELLTGEVTPENTTISTPKASLKFMQMGGTVDGDGKKKKKQNDYGGLFEVIGDDTGTQSIDTGVKNLDAFYSPIREKVNMFIKNNPEAYKQSTGTFRNLNEVLNNPNLLIDAQGKTYESKQRSAPSLEDPNVRKLQQDILGLISDDTLKKLSKKDLTGSSKAGAIRKLAGALGWDSFKVPGIANRIQEYADQGYTFKYGGKVGCKKSKRRLNGSITLKDLIKNK